MILRNELFSKIKTYLFVRIILNTFIYNALRLEKNA